MYHITLEKLTDNVEPEKVTRAHTTIQTLARNGSCPAGLNVPLLCVTEFMLLPLTPWSRVLYEKLAVV
jgi:hypothetical protein